MITQDEIVTKLAFLLCGIFWAAFSMFMPYLEKYERSGFFLVGVVLVGLSPFIIEKKKTAQQSRQCDVASVMEKTAQLSQNGPSSHVKHGGFS